MQKTCSLIQDGDSYVMVIDGTNLRFDVTKQLQLLLEHQIKERVQSIIDNMYWLRPGIDKEQHVRYLQILDIVRVDMPSGGAG